MSRHAEDWKVKKKNPLEKHNQWSKREGEKGKCCCGKIIEEGDQVEEAFCEQQLKSPKEPRNVGGTQSPFGNGEYKPIAQAHGNVFIQREENTAQK